MALKGLRRRFALSPLSARTRIWVREAVASMPEHFGTLAQAFEKQARKHGSRTFLKQKRDKVWRDFAWSEIAEAAGKLRAGLIAMGIKPGDRIAILSDNSPQWV